MITTVEPDGTANGFDCSERQSIINAWPATAEAETS